MEPKSTKVVPLDTLVEQIRAACIQAALDGYETAAADGLCAEGAWECAVDAMRHADLAALVQGAADQTSSR